MGDIISGVIGGVGSLVAGGVARKADKAGAQQALTGYNYLSGDKGIQGFVNNGNAANTDASALLTGGPGSTAARSAYGNYLNSTGYQFQRDQGSQAITGNAASRGVLNSGGTAKALTRFGQNIGGSYFSNYLNQLNTQATNGLNAAGMIGQAGTVGGGNAGKLTAQGGADMGNADAAAGAQFGKAAGSAFNFLAL